MNKQFPFRHHQSNKISPQFFPPKKWFLCVGHKTVTPQANIYPLKKLWQSILSIFFLPEFTVADFWAECKDSF
jgi:hypothetical protein